MCLVGKSRVSVPRVFQEPWESPQMKDMGKSSQEEVATTGTGSLFPQELLSTILPWGFLSALGLAWPFPISLPFIRLGLGRLQLSHEQSQNFRSPVGEACGAQGWVPTPTQRLMAQQFGGSQNSTVGHLTKTDSQEPVTQCSSLWVGCCLCL